MRAVAEQLRSEWTDVDFRFELAAIAAWRAAAGGWAELATRARNAALGAIRRAGHPHCLVADGDELWRPGVFVALADLIRARRPSAIESRWLPVVGLIGYPVGAATDQATMYAAAHASFVTARRECGARTRLPGRGIVYGTATRRTMAEIVRTQRERSPYDDPAYDLEDWIANVPPRVRTGFVGAHPFRSQQIWPRVRRWEPAELAAIPASLRGFLGTETEAAAAVFPDPADGGLHERQLPSTVRAPAIEHMSPLLAAKAAGPLQFWRRDGLAMGADRDRHAREFQPKTTR